MKSLEVVAKNVELAITQGLNQLGLERDDVNIRIIDAGGMFKKAKVVLEYEEKEPEIPVVEETAEQALAVEEKSVEEVKQDNKQAEVKNPRENKSALKAPTEKEPEVEKAVIDYITGIAQSINAECEPTVCYSDTALEINFSGNGIDKLIGYHGDKLNAIQTLVSHLPIVREKQIRVSIDFVDYKSRRREDLAGLAQRMIDRIKAGETQISLRPMSAYERKIIHEIVMATDGVESESFGEGRDRHIVIRKTN